jgi:tRNA(His) guanylyltransferase
MMQTVKKNNTKKDSLGDRIKNYEDCFRQFLPNRSYVMIRVDGNAFHTFTKHLNKPFDDDLLSDMDDTAKFMCASIQGAKLAYVQSDEISIVVTNFETFDTQMWFEGNIQKMCSISASLATAKFNELRNKRWFENLYLKYPDNRYGQIKSAMFDSRIFILPNKSETMNALLWRQNDAVRNSISMVAQSMFSHRELQGKNSDQMQEMIFQNGVNWNDIEPGKKRGRIIKKVFYANGTNLQSASMKDLFSLANVGGYDAYIDIPESEIKRMLIEDIINSKSYTIRSKWECVDTPNRFTENGFNFLSSIIPENE